MMFSADVLAACSFGHVIIDVLRVAAKILNKH
jgi:hypothetical protein